MIGATVGSYRIVERLGEGGTGEVYRAKHLHLDREAAIKLLLLELSRDREVVDRFFSEARATSLIHHPGIVEVLDCNVHEDGRVYLVMELLSGETLRDRMTRAPELGRDLDTVWEIAAQIAHAIGAAHRLGIVHRDLKPENVFLVGDPAKRQPPKVKVLDFGIAKLLDSENQQPSAATSHTSANRILGTPTYMSPEQCKDARLVDNRSDIYSLGCVLFEMLSGRAPFIRATFAELIAAHLWEAPPSLSDVGRDVAPAAEALVSDMLAKAPEARPATMEEVLSRIDAVKNDVVKKAAGKSAAGKSADGTKIAGDDHAGRVPSPRWSWWIPPRFRTPGWLAGGTALVGGLALGWVALHKHRAGPLKAGLLPEQAALQVPKLPAATEPASSEQAPGAQTSGAQAELSDAPLAGTGPLEAGSGGGESQEAGPPDIIPSRTSSKAVSTPRRARRIPEPPELSDEQRKL